MNTTTARRTEAEIVRPIVSRVVGDGEWRVRLADGTLLDDVLVRRTEATPAGGRRRVVTVREADGIARLMYSMSTGLARIVSAHYCWPKVIDQAIYLDAVEGARLERVAVAR